MALAYELECERNNGDWRLRREPGQKELNGEAPKDLAEASGQGKVAEETEKLKSDKPVPVPETRGAWGTTIPKDVVEEGEPKSIDEVLESTHVSTPEVQAPESISETAPTTPEINAQPIQQSELVVEESTQTTAPEIQATDSTEEVPTESPPQPEPPVEEVLESDSEGSDGGGWITPSNIKKHQAKANTNSKKTEGEPQNMEVAIITSDFAMQNVILRMNLNLLSPTLMRIKQLKTWVLRCHACFSITKDMTKQFCGRCGKPTLMRTSCTTKKDGKVIVHLKKNMQWNTRGNVYSIPKPVAGTSNGKLVQGGGKGGWGQGLILAEDQKEYIQAMTGASRKKEKNLMDEDFLPSILSGDRGRAGGRPKVGAGKNVNSRKRN